jgi:hypothetical protein
LESGEPTLFAKLGVAPWPVNPFEKVGIDQGALNGEQPLNGLRHPPESGTSGWFIWGGEELSEADDFFMPMHIEHLAKECPAVLPYLGLPPGWRFLIAGDYEDVWFDELLLSV